MESVEAEGILYKLQLSGLRTHFRTLHSCPILKYYLLRKCVTNRKWILLAEVATQHF